MRVATEESFIQQAHKSFLAEFLTIAEQIIITHLVNDDAHYKLLASTALLTGWGVFLRI